MKNLISKSVANEILEMKVSKVEKKNSDNTNKIVLLFFTVAFIVAILLNHYFPNPLNIF